MTREEQNLNWDAVIESGSMTAIHNIREYIKNLEKENESLCEENTRLKKTVIFLGNTIRSKKEMWDYFESRFVKVNDCSEEQKANCLMFPEYCEGERCSMWLDMVDLLDKAADNGKVM